MVIIMYHAIYVFLFGNLLIIALLLVVEQSLGYSANGIIKSQKKTFYNNLLPGILPDLE